MAYKGSSLQVLRVGNRPKGSRLNRAQPESDVR
jgi:hypothetical protein